METKFIHHYNIHCSFLTLGRLPTGSPMFLLCFHLRLLFILVKPVQVYSTGVQEYSAVDSAVLFQKVKVKHDDKRVQLDSLSIGTGPRIQVRTGYDSAQGYQLSQLLPLRLFKSVMISSYLSTEFLVTTPARSCQVNVAAGQPGQWPMSPWGCVLTFLGILTFVSVSLGRRR